MTLDLTCTECEASFEVDTQTLLDAPKTLECPNCEAKAPARKAEALASAIEDLTGAMRDLASKFEISLAAETSDLSEAEEADSEEEAEEEDSHAKKEDDDDEEDEEEEEDDDEGELEFNE